MKVLIVNPNSSRHMTEAARNGVLQLAIQNNVTVEAYTAPTISPVSIDNDDDIISSTNAVVSDLFPRVEYLGTFDAILVACFSVHPLVHMLYSRLKGKVPVIGIFEAGITIANSITPPLGATETRSKWAIVTTGRFWEKHLSDGVVQTLGLSQAFAGVFSTGMNAGDFHEIDPARVREKLEAAVNRALEDNVRAVVMGCAGMAGLEATIRGTAIGKLGEHGKDILVIDGVKAGLLQAVQMVQSNQAFRAPS